MPALITSWREGRARRRLQSDARQMVVDVRDLLKKRSHRIPESVAAELEQAAAAVEAAIARDDHEGLQASTQTLEGKINQHLSFARKSSLREYGESIFVAIGIAVLLRAFVVEAFQIPSGSMIPTLEIGDHIFVSKFSYGFVIPFTNKKVLQYDRPDRGDVIVFKFPHQTEIDYIKRVIGLPGDRVEVRRGEIFINEKAVQRELLRDRPCRFGDEPREDCERWRETLDGHSHVALHEIGRTQLSSYGPSVVPPGHVFVMGDNRDNSNDSRAWGTVPEEYIKGRALIIWWSRAPADAGLSPEGLKRWFSSIRWERFFQLVK